jgi:hypothetical protein
MLRLARVGIQEGGLLPQRLRAGEAPQDEVHREGGGTRNALRFVAPRQGEGRL